MPLSPGTRLGVYQVAEKIGAGGMGEVYRPRDTKLDRDVALKVLPDTFASDPERLGRFQREAKVLASLNHPNIGSIYGFEEGEAEGTRALVLELIEGPTLAERIAQGPIPLDEALQIAQQIAEALEAAHEQGIIHRDLKPANIKVKPDGSVKVLDFGLAKALDPSYVAQGFSPASASPTISLTAAATQMGMVIGTAAYMSPEQARGKPVDKRADIWAFGVVLHEMLTGARPFQGEDVSLTLASVMKSDVDPKKLPPDVPAAVRTVLRRCLEKDPSQRIRDVGDVRLAMTGAFETTAATPSESVAATPLRLWQRPASALGIPLMAVLVTGLAVWGLTRPDVVPADVMRFVIPPPDGTPFDFGALYPDLAISADGTQIVYQARPAGGEPQLHLRLIDQLGGTPLRGAEGGVAPFFSPEGEWVGFVDDGARTTLRKVSIAGGPPVTLADLPATMAGASWGADDQIIVGTVGGGLFRVPGGGGEPEALMSPEADQGELGHYWPSIIPDRQAVLFGIDIGDGPSAEQLAVLALDTGDVTRLGLVGSSPRYAPTGHLAYAVEDGSVRAAPFDVDRLEVTGSPVPLVEGVVVKNTGAASFDVAGNGRLMYASGGVASGERSLAWVDGEGRMEPIGVPRRGYVHARLSPDGARVALDSRAEENDLWTWDFARGTLQPLTVGPGRQTGQVWHPDGARIAFRGSMGGVEGLYWQAADGSGTAERLAEGPYFPTAFTPDGTRLLFHQPPRTPPHNVGMVSLDGERRVELLLEGPSSELNAEISPDGRWIAYQSDESEQFEIYVRPFPDVNASREQVSSDGGTRPLWSRDGRELFYWVNSGAIMAVPVEVGTDFTAGRPEVATQGTLFAPGVTERFYDVSPDGGRFLVITDVDTEAGEPAPARITGVLNWSQELLERVPVN